MIKKYKAVVFGSVPVSLSELQLGPAVVLAALKNNGYSNTKLVDINMLLFNHCNRDRELYLECVEQLLSFSTELYHPVIIEWLTELTRQYAAQSEFILLNVLSSRSQLPVIKLIHEFKNLDCKILLGGIGSLLWLNAGSYCSITAITSGDSIPIANQKFTDFIREKPNVIDCQPDASHSLIDHYFPKKIIPAKTTLKYADYSDFILNDYLWHTPAIPLETSKGCVRKCTFCDVAVHFSKYKLHNIDATTNTIIDAVKATNIPKIQFLDSLINGSMSGLATILSNIVFAKEKNMLPKNFTWSGTYICRPITSKSMQIHRLLKDSGADNLIIGVETGSDQLRFKMDKKFTNQDLVAELSIFKDIQVKASLLFFPSFISETTEDFNKTIALLASLKKFNISVIDTLNFGQIGFSLLPGTPVFDLVQQGKIIQGPLPFLWVNPNNPELNLFTMIDRRLSLSSVALSLGYNLYNEPEYLQNIIASLQLNKKTIVDFLNKFNIKKTVSAPKNVISSKNTFQLTISNRSGNIITLAINNKEFKILPGLSTIETSTEEHTILLTIYFHSTYTPELNTFSNNEIYSKNGVEINSFKVNDREIAYFELPALAKSNYHDINLSSFQINYRFIANNISINLQPPENLTLDEFLTTAHNTELNTNIKKLHTKIKNIIKEFT